MLPGPVDVTLRWSVLRIVGVGMLGIALELTVRVAVTGGGPGVFVLPPAPTVVHAPPTVNGGAEGTPVFDARLA